MKTSEFSAIPDQEHEPELMIPEALRDAPAEVEPTLLVQVQGTSLRRGLRVTVRLDHPGDAPVARLRYRRKAPMPVGVADPALQFHLFSGVVQATVVENAPLEVTSDLSPVVVRVMRALRQEGQVSSPARHHDPAGGLWPRHFQEGQPVGSRGGTGTLEGILQSLPGGRHEGHLYPFQGAPVHEGSAPDCQAAGQGTHFQADFGDLDPTLGGMPEGLGSGRGQPGHQLGSRGSLRQGSLNRHQSVPGGLGLPRQGEDGGLQDLALLEGDPVGQGDALGPDLGRHSIDPQQWKGPDREGQDAGLTVPDADHSGFDQGNLDLYLRRRSQRDAPGVPQFSAHPDPVTGGTRTQADLDLLATGPGAALGRGRLQLDQSAPLLEVFRGWLKDRRRVPMYRFPPLKRPALNLADSSRKGGRTWKGRSCS